MASEFANDRAGSRYTMHVDGEFVGALDYAENDATVSLTRAFTVPSHRGKGYAADLVEFAVNDIEHSGTKRIVPMCWYVADWFAAHGERGYLLER